MLIISILIHANILVGLNSLVGESSIASKNQALNVNIVSVPQTFNLTKEQENKQLSESVNKSNQDNVDLRHPHESVETKKNDNGLLSFNTPIYYVVEELDVIPSPLSDISDQLPQLDKFQDAGKLEIQLWLDEKGSVEKARVINTNLPADLNKVLVDNFLSLKFTEAQKNNVPVKSTIKITLNISSV